MDISLIDPSIATSDAVILVNDGTFPVWDLVYAHQIGMPTATRKTASTGSGRKRKDRKREENGRRTNQNSLTD
jgi:hypothetical protein